MVARTLALALALASCEPANEPLRPAPSGGIVWNGGNGWTTLTIEASGKATYDFHPQGWGSEGRSPEKKSLVLSRADLDALMATLHAQHACGLRASGRAREPEEHDEELTLDLPGMKCTVSMLANDWSRTPRAHAVEQALGAVIEQVRASGAPP